MYSFPLGIASLCGASILALGHPLGRLAAPIVLVATICPLAIWKRPQQVAERSDALRVARDVLPFAVAFGVFMALLWHGPTATLAARPLGDMVYYAGLVDTLPRHLWPIPNLAVLGDVFAWSNSVPSAIAAAVSLYVPIDPFIYLAGWGASFYVLSFSVSLFLVAPRAAATPVRFGCAFAFLLASIYDPTWMVNSIPASITFPLFFLAWNIVQQRRGTLGKTVVDVLIMILGSALAKVTSVVCLVPLVVLSSRRPRLRDMSFGQITLAGLALSLGSVYIWLMLERFGPTYWSYFVSSGAGPFSYRGFSVAGLTTITYLAFLVRDVGSALFIVAALVCARGPLRLVAALGAALFLVYPLFFTLPLLGVTLLMGLAVLKDADVFARGPSLIGSTAALLLLATLTVDPGQLQTSIAWIVCMGGACLVALRGPSRFSLKLTGAGAAVLALGTVAVAIGAWRMTTGDRRPYAPRTWLTPAFRDIWLAVADKTPPGSLIFTDRTGYDGELQGGADLYAIFGRRQVFVAGVIDSNLYADPVARTERFDQNREVLEGRLAPNDRADTRPYASYYAVTLRSTSLPAGWETIYQNDDFRLSHIR